MRTDLSPAKQSVMERQSQLLSETLTYYEANPRGITPFGCVYSANAWGAYGDAKCAVGRCMTDEAMESYGDFEGSINYLLQNGVKSENCDDILREEFHGLGIDFWVMLQTIHDDDDFWADTDDGLYPHKVTERGLGAVSVFRLMIGQGTFTHHIEDEEA